MAGGKCADLSFSHQIKQLSRYVWREMLAAVPFQSHTEVEPPIKVGVFPYLSNNHILLRIASHRLHWNKHKDSSNGATWQQNRRYNTCGLLKQSYDNSPAEQLLKQNEKMREY